MSDRGYGEGRGWRDRDSSIFTDDDDRWGRGADRWSSEHGRERHGEGRSFLERAGDEVKSWFRDDDSDRQGGQSGSYDRSYRSNNASGWQAGSERSAFRGQGWDQPRSKWDRNYLEWRDRQIEQFDREYDEYCRDCQEQFDRDFDSWRNSRLTAGGAAYGAESGLGAGMSGSAASSRESAETTAGGGGESSAAQSSTGSSGGETATGGTLGSASSGAARSRSSSRS